jgi:DNA topoisomerase I
MTNHKWKTLHHSGVFFPDTQAPPHVTVRVRGEPVHLSREAQRFAARYACMKKHNDHDKTFEQNFWKDWQGMLPKELAALSLKDFTISTSTCASPRGLAPKKKCSATVDGVQESVASCTVEGEGLFLGRGDNPLRGRLRRGVKPEEVTLNMGGTKQKPPSPPAGHRWGGIVHEKGSWWLAKWTDPLTGKTKYVWLAGSSKWKGQSDKEKFDRARAMKGGHKKFRAAVDAMMRNAMMRNAKDTTEMQCGLILHLLDSLAIRIGKGKSGDGRVVGLTSLRKEHVKILTAGKVSLDFLGKDSIRYHREVTLPKHAMKALRQCMLEAKNGGLLFPDAHPDLVNAKIDSILPGLGLTAKTFRTFRASTACEKELMRLEKGVAHGDTAGAKKALTEARMAAAHLCNHVRNDKIETSTAVNNYLDPRITFAFAKRVSVPPEKLMSPSQMARFEWAKDAPKSFRF